MPGTVLIVASTLLTASSRTLSATCKGVNVALLAGQVTKWGLMEIPSQGLLEAAKRGFRTR